MKKKFGFTLAETLLAITIVGIISAILLPMANKLKPNDNKVLYLKAYDTLGQVLNTVTSSKKLYSSCKYKTTNGGTAIEGGIDCSEIPLFNTDFAFGYEGDTKLCNILAYSLGAKEDTYTCDKTPYPTYAANTVFKTSTFITQNGMRWRVSPQIETKSDPKYEKGYFEAVVYVDIDGEKNGKNCIYNKTNCTNPDIFKFLIDASGGITPADAMGEKYLTTRLSFVSKDLPESTSDIIATLADDERVFETKLCEKIETEDEDNDEEEGGDEEGGNDETPKGGGTGEGCGTDNSNVVDLPNNMDQDAINIGLDCKKYPKDPGCAGVVNGNGGRHRGY